MVIKVMEAAGLHEEYLSVDDMRSVLLSQQLSHSVQAAMATAESENKLLSTVTKSVAHQIDAALMSLLQLIASQTDIKDTQWVFEGDTGTPQATAGSIGTKEHSTTTLMGLL